MVPTGIVELRMLNGRGTASGYFDADHRSEAVTAAARYAGRYGVYFIPNPVLPALLSRASNRVIDFPKQTTADADIERRVYLLIDLDAKRPAGISSSDAEHDAALARTQELVVFLREQAWPEPVAIADSGNGGHADYAIDLPNDVESRDLVKRVLEALDLRFSDSVVQVDLTTFNSARIWKLYGTPAIKGDNTFERPHRMSRIIASAPREPVSRALLEKLAATVPQVDAGARVRGRFDCKPG